MREGPTIPLAFLAAAVALLAAPEAEYAYGGPGSILSGIEDATLS